MRSFPQAGPDSPAGLGADVLAINPPSYLRVALVYRKSPLTPSAEAFLDTAKQYAAEQH